MKVWWDELSKASKRSAAGYPNGRPLTASPTIRLNGKPLRMVRFADDEKGVVQTLEIKERDGGRLLGTITTLEKRTHQGRIEICFPLPYGLTTVRED